MAEPVTARDLIKRHLESLASEGYRTEEDARREGLDETADLIRDSLAFLEKGPEGS